MRSDDVQQDFRWRVRAGLLVAGGLALACNSGAATGVGTGSATVVEPVSVTIVVPPVFPGTTFNLESFQNSLSTSGPMLRAVAPPPPVSNVPGGEGATGTTSAAGALGAGAGPSAASAATVSVTRKADGSLGVSGGANLTFGVSQSVSGAINIEYN